MRRKWTSSQAENLLKAATYREFIKEVIALRSETETSFGYSDIARRAGFSARSFPREVLKGTRRISPASLHPFGQGLGLSGDWFDYFKLLVELEEADCREKIKDETKVLQLLENLRRRLREKQKSLPALRDEDIFYSYHVPFVYAALGSKQKGATLAQIRERSKLEGSTILPILKKLIDAGVVRQSASTYFATENHLNLAGLKESEIYRSFYLHLLSQASLSARTRFKSNKHLFFSSSFSVASKDLPRLKEELRSVLLRFVDASEFSDGDQVVSVAASLF